MDNPARPPKARSEEKKKTLYVRFADFLRKYRAVVLAFSGAVVLAVLVLAVVTGVRDSAVKASTARLEKLDADFAAYSGEQDAAKKESFEKAFFASADEMIKRGPRLYAAQKASIYKAKIEESKKDWAAAEKDWLAIVEAVPDSYLAPVALQGAAVAAEELGSADRATADYKKLIDKYSATAIGIPHAYFALGRLAEQAKDYSAAMTAYQKIASTWPDDDWTKLATDRIISLKSEGPYEIEEAEMAREAREVLRDPDLRLRHSGRRHSDSPRARLRDRPAPGARAEGQRQQLPGQAFPTEHGRQGRRRSTPSRSPESPTTS